MQSRVARLRPLHCLQLLCRGGTVLQHRRKDAVAAFVHAGQRVSQQARGCPGEGCKLLKNRIAACSVGSSPVHYDSDRDLMHAFTFCSSSILIMQRAAGIAEAPMQAVPSASTVSRPCAQPATGARPTAAVVLPRRTALVLVPALFAAPAAWAKDAEATRRACVLTFLEPYTDEQRSMLAKKLGSVRFA